MFLYQSRKKTCYTNPVMVPKTLVYLKEYQPCEINVIGKSYFQISCSENYIHFIVNIYYLIGYDYTAYMDYMDLAVRCPLKGHCI